MPLVIINIVVKGKVININLEDSEGYSKVSVVIIHVEEIISFIRNNNMDTITRPPFSMLPSSQETPKTPLPP